MASIQTVRQPTATDQVTPWYIIGGLTLVVLVTYGNSIMALAGSWTSAQYSHGFLVPLFTVVLLSMRRQPFEPVSTSARWWGVAIITGGLLLRLFGSKYSFNTIDRISIIPVLAGVFVIAGGWSAFRWSAAPLAFLVFMLPLPTKVEQTVLAPLQSVATVMSNYTLQTVGLDSHAEGNNILLDGVIPLNVAEACSGLRMSTIFLAMAVAMTMIIERPVWQKACIIVSAIPIALVTNMIRIVITALLMQALGPDSELAKRFFHDLAGWFMMPIALGFLYAEMQLLDHLIVEEETTAPTTVGGFGGHPAPVRRPATTRSH